MALLSGETAGSDADPNIAAVCDLIRAAFTPEDLRRFCRDRPAFADLLNYFGPNSGLERLIDDVVEYCQTRRLFRELLREIEASRPRQYEFFRGRLFAPTAATEVATQGIDAVTRQLAEPRARDAVVAFRAVFETAYEPIRRLGEYKQVHDWFHHLLDLYKILGDEAGEDPQRLATNQRAWARLMRHEPEVQGLVGSLLNAAEVENSVIAGAFWIRGLRSVREELRQAIEALDEQKLAQAVGRMGRVLDRAPSQINDRLVETAMSLHLAELARAMGSVRDALPESNGGSSVAGEITAGVHTLRKLDRRLATLVHEHNLWQEIQNQLSWIEANLADDVRSVCDAWPDLLLLGGELCGDGTADWAAEFADTSTQLSEVLESGDAVRITMLFLRYSSQASRQFSRVDRDLLGLCQDLQSVGASLSALTRAMHDG